MKEKQKPIWIPIVGYLVVVGGLTSLADMITSWFMGSPSLDLGFVGIWIGAGVIQYHWRSARVMALFSFLGAGIATILFVVTVIGGGNLEGPNFFPESEFGLRISIGLISGVIAGLLIGLSVSVFRSRVHFDNLEAKFHPRDIRRESLPPIIGILSLVLSISVVNIQWERREQLIKAIEQFEVYVVPIDAESGENLVYGTSFNTEILQSGGIGRIDTQGPVIGDQWRFTCIGTHPFSGVVNLNRDGYESASVEFVIEKPKTVERLEIKMMKLEQVAAGNVR